MNTPARRIALLATVAAGILGGCRQATKSPDVCCGAGPNGASSSRSLLSTEGQALLRATIGSGDSDLRWPDFSDYSKHVKEFYEFNGNSLWWVKDSEPTPQAQQV